MPDYGKSINGQIYIRNSLGEYVPLMIPDFTSTATISACESIFNNELIGNTYIPNISINYAQESTESTEPENLDGWKALLEE